MDRFEICASVILGCVLFGWFACLGALAVALAGPWFGAGLFGGCLFVAGLGVGAVMSNGNRD